MTFGRDYDRAVRGETWNGYAGTVITRPAQVKARYWTSEWSNLIHVSTGRGLYRLQRTTNGRHVGGDVIIELGCGATLSHPQPATLPESTPPYPTCKRLCRRCTCLMDPRP